MKESGALPIRATRWFLSVPPECRSIVAVKLFAARYGHEEPPNEDFHIYLLDQDQKVLEQIPIPYGKVERGELRWQTFTFPPVEVPEKFFVALWFNAERTKGVFRGHGHRRQGVAFLRRPAG